MAHPNGLILFGNGSNDCQISNLLNAAGYYAERDADGLFFVPEPDETQQALVSELTELFGRNDVPVAIFQKVYTTI